MQPSVVPTLPHTKLFAYCHGDKALSDQDVFSVFSIDQQVGTEQAQALVELRNIAQSSPQVVALRCLLFDNACEQYVELIKQSISAVFNQGTFLEKKEVQDHMVAASKNEMLTKRTRDSYVALLKIIDDSIRCFVTVDCTRAVYQEKSAVHDRIQHYEDLLKYQPLQRFMDTPDAKKSLSGILTLFKNGRNRLTFTITPEKKHALPSDELLKKKIAHYRHKYNITITHIHIKACAELPALIEIKTRGEYLLSLLQMKMQVATPRLEGILYGGDEYVGHVVPILFQMTQKGPFVLILDVLGACQGHSRYIEVLQVLKTLKIPYAQAREKRQASIIGCGLGGLITLRNALLDLKHAFKVEESIVNYLNDGVKREKTHVMVKSYLDIKEINTFSIPSQWAFTDEIYHSNDACDILNPRQCDSKQKKTPQTITVSRKAYQKEMTYHYQLKGWVYAEHAIHLPELVDPHMKVAIIEDEADKANQCIVIEWKETLIQNAYMLEKGYKVASKYQALNLLAAAQ